MITSHKYCSVPTVAVGAVAAVGAVLAAVVDVISTGDPGHMDLCLYILVRCLNTFLQEVHVYGSDGIGGVFVWYVAFS